MLDVHCGMGFKRVLKHFKALTPELKMGSIPPKYSLGGLILFLIHGYSFGGQYSSPYHLPQLLLPSPFDTNTHHPKVSNYSISIYCEPIL